ncbi:MAG: type II toxin-antitoxin system PemK/MazF family toxin [Burkholderiales bacterium]|nr:type II toxin-antitoxin system PemK/MazF family toxin [Burkholderiales bacterium]
MPLDVGDIHWAELDGFRGTEQGGRRPVLIVSQSFYNVRSSRVIVCPISTRSRGWKTEIALPGSLAVTGVVLADQIRALDRSTRIFDFIDALPESHMGIVRQVLALLLGIMPPAPEAAG